MHSELYSPQIRKQNASLFEGLAPSQKATFTETVLRFISIKIAISEEPEWLDRQLGLSQ